MLLLHLLLFVTLLFSLTARIAFRYCCCCCCQQRMQQISRRNARTARKSFERRRRSNSNSSRQRRQQRREQLSKWHICCGSDCGCRCLWLCHCRRQLEGSFRQAALALALVSSSYRCDCCVWRVPRTMLDYRVSRDIANSISCRFFWFCVFILYLILFDLFTCCCLFFAHFSLALGTHLFEALCVCVTTSVIGGVTAGEGEGRRASGARRWR